MVGPFSHRGNPALIFGNGTVAGLAKQLEGSGQVLFVTGRHFPETAAWRAIEKDIAAAGIRFSRETVSGEPSPEVVDTLAAEARSDGTEAVVAIGGGSVLDAGKAVAAMLRHEGSVFDYLEGVGSRNPEGRTAPMIAVPTTAGTGSEATKNAVISRRGPEGFKKSLRHDAFIPPVALIDPELAVGCPPEVSRACGMDAFSQLLESFVSTGSTPFTDALAREGILRFARGSRLLSENRYGSDDEVEDRGNLALAAYCSGLTLANAGLGTVHGIAGPLGAVCEVPHGAACGLLAPPVFKRVAAGLEGNDPDGFLDKLAWTGAVLASGGDEPTGTSDRSGNIARLLDILEGLAAALPRLTSFGFTPADIRGAAAASGNKNSPVSLSEDERIAVLEEVL